VAVLWGAVAASLAVAALGVIWIKDLVRVDGETILVQTRYGPFSWRRRIKQSQVSRVFASSASNHKTVLFIKVAERLEALSRRGASREAVERAARQLQAALNLKTAVDPEYEAAIPSPWVLTQDASGASVLTRGGRMGRWLVGTLALLLATLTFAVAIATLLKFLDEWGNVEMLGLALVSVLAGLASIGLSGLAARNGWCRDEWRCSTTGVFRVRRCGPRLHVLAQVQSLCITPWKQPASWGVDEFILEAIAEPVEYMRGQRGARWTNVVLLRAPYVSTEALALGRWLAERSGLELRVLETPMIRDVYG
jgi:hypothetical protein